MSHATRRALLAGLPAVAVAGIPAAAALADAELLAIGRELEPVVAERREALRLDAVERAAFNRRCEAAIGPKNDSDEYITAKRAFIISERDGGPDVDDDGYNGHRGWSAINGDLDKITSRALALKATTREGFAVQVLAWTVDYCEVVEEYPEFFGAVCGYAGVPMPEQLAG
jgi:hypothetical protein